MRVLPCALFLAWAATCSPQTEGFDNLVAEAIQAHEQGRVENAYALYEAAIAPHTHTFITILGAEKRITVDRGAYARASRMVPEGIDLVRVSLALHNMGVIEHGRAKNHAAVNLVTGALDVLDATHHTDAFTRIEGDPPRSTVEIKQTETFSNYLNSLGAIQRASGDWGSALDALLCAALLDPSSAQPVVTLASLLHHDALNSGPHGLFEAAGTPGGAQGAQEGRHNLLKWAERAYVAALARVSSSVERDTVMAVTTPLVPAIERNFIANPHAVSYTSVCSDAVDWGEHLARPPPDLERDFRVVLKMLNASSSSSSGGGSNGRDGGSGARAAGLELELRNELAMVYQKLGMFHKSVDVLRATVEVYPYDLQAHGNLAIGYKELGLLEEALRHALVAAEISPDMALVHYNLASTYYAMGDFDQAMQAYARTISLDPSLHQARASLGHILGGKGDIVGARENYAEALAIARELGDVGEAASLTLQHATAWIPHIYESRAHILQVRANLTRGMLAVLDSADRDARMVIPDPMSSTGAAALGYYVIYQGFNDVHIRRLLAQVYWKLSPPLLYTAPFLRQPSNPRSRAHQDAADESSGSRRIRVGFMSAFFYHHSVGLLTQGVITGINKERFEVVVIHPPMAAHDDVTQRIYDAADRVVRTPYDLSVSQAMVGDLELDVLVYCEIGMDRLNYFLAFARLARRSVSFWGHATTSGVTHMDDPRCRHGNIAHQRHVCGGIDYFVSSRLFERPAPSLSPHGNSQQHGTAVDHYGTNMHSEGAGLLSGVHREALLQSNVPQERYSEKLYLMDSLTTRFLPPAPPTSRLMTTDIGLPPRSSMHLYLIPQTLYKLHPDFDVLIQGILDGDKLGYVAMPMAQREEWTHQVLRRMTRTLGSVLMQRVHVIRRLSFDEFTRVCSLAHVVLDPFPVGGGRSSFEILSVGTPIVMLYPRTSILQLTYGMYKTMGIMDCVTYTSEDFVGTAIAIGTNETLRGDLHRRIKEHNHKIFDSSEVVGEWEHMFERILSSAPPDHGTHFKRNATAATTIARPNGSYTLGYGNRGAGKGAALTQHGDGEDTTTGGERATPLTIGVETPLDTMVGGGTEVPITFTSDRTVRRSRRSSSPSSSPSSSSSWGWQAHGWGWEALSHTESHRSAPNERAHDLEYAVKLSHENPKDGQVSSFLLEVFHGEIVDEKLSAFAKYIDAEPVKHAWMQCVLHNAVRQGYTVHWNVPLGFVDARTGIPIDPHSVHYTTPNVSSGVWMQSTFPIRVGDDLSQRAMWFGYRYSVGDEMAAALAKRFKRLTPMHTSPEWIHARTQSRCGLRPSPLPQQREQPVWGQHRQRTAVFIPSRDVRTTPCITVVITTCKRLDLFRKTARSLLRALGNSFEHMGMGNSGKPSDVFAGTVVKSVVVIDDHSPTHERVAMLEEFPQFEFHFKPPHERGHANSLNRMLALVRTPYLLYLEDDWLTLTDTVDGLIEAIHVMQATQGSLEPISQVLLNDQATRDCAYGVPDGCGPGVIGSAGWPRTVGVADDRGHNAEIPFRLHEFGTLDPAHGFTYWPGFTLNPAVWNLAALGSLMERGGGLSFDEGDRRFEQSISLELFTRGANVAYLPRLMFRHIGVDVSAYHLNNITRPWEE